MFEKLRKKILQDDESWAFFVFCLLLGIVVVPVVIVWNNNRSFAFKDSNIPVKVYEQENKNKDKLWIIYDAETEKELWKVRETIKKKLDYQL